ncbi:MAG: TlpA family protein disulfide reductase [Cyanobacteria bacterium]|nr:TlpA family protein disulfide reductase [Cyanobacteriota bacterium]
MTKKTLKAFLKGVSLLGCLILVGYAFYDTLNHEFKGSPEQTTSNLASTGSPPSNPSSSGNSKSPGKKTATPDPMADIPPPLPVGDKATDFTLTSFDGKPYQLKSLAGKKLVFLEFFSPRCPHCQKIAPIIKAIDEKYSGTLQVLAINCGDDPKKHVSSSIYFQEMFETHYPLLDWPPSALLDSYKVSGLPTTYLIGKDGKILWNHLGEFKGPDLEKFQTLMAKYE